MLLGSDINSKEVRRRRTLTVAPSDPSRREGCQAAQGSWESATLPQAEEESSRDAFSQKKRFAVCFKSGRRGAS